MSENSERNRLLESLAAIAEDIWLTAEPYGLNEIKSKELLISRDQYDRLYLALNELEVTETAEDYLFKSNWDSCLEKTSIPIGHNSLAATQAPVLRPDVRFALQARDGGAAIRISTRHKLGELQCLAEQDLCPAWAIVATAKKVVELDRADVPSEKIDLVKLLSDVFPEWQTVRDYLFNKRERAKTAQATLQSTEVDA